MQNTRLILLLKTFSPSEMKEFKDFVSSPVFNKNKNVIRLQEVLRKFYPEFINSKLTDEKIFEMIFPGEKYNYFKIKNISSDLFVLGKEFLIFLYQKNNDIYNYKDVFLLSELRDRKLDSVFDQLHKIYSDKLEASTIKDENYFFQIHLLTDEMSFYLAPREPNTNLPLLQQSMNNFLKYSLIKLLKIYNIMLHEKKQNNFNYEMNMLDEVLSYIDKNKSDDNPTLMIYYYIILLEKEKQEKYFFELKNLKEKFFDYLARKDQYMLFLHMAGYCAYVFNVLGKKDFMMEHFLLSKENFDKGTIKLGHIIYMDFLNHVKIAVRVEKFDWAEKYINEFKESLTEEKNSTLNFCYGYINYKKGNLNKALDLLSQANFPNFIIKIQVKILLLQIYFEKEYYEQALAMIDTFRHYLLREKSIVEDFKESFYDYLRITNDLIKLKTMSDSDNKEFNLKKIKDDLEKIKYNQFGIKMWLREISNH